MNRYLGRKSRFKLISTMVCLTALSINNHANQCTKPDFSGMVYTQIFCQISFPQLFDHQGLYDSGPFFIGLWDDGHDQKGSKINKKLRKQWIDKAVNEFFEQRLKETIPSLLFETKEFDGFYQKSIKLKTSGIIAFADNSWLYLVAHSAHDDPGIGDMTLGIDHLGNVYMNEGHICGGIIHFIINQKITVSSIGDFIRNFRDDTEGKSWKKIRYKHKNLTALKK